MLPLLPFLPPLCSSAPPSCTPPPSVRVLLASSSFSLARTREAGGAGAERSPRVKDMRGIGAALGAALALSLVAPTRSNRYGGPSYQQVTVIEEINAQGQQTIYMSTQTQAPPGARAGSALSPQLQMAARSLDRFPREALLEVVGGVLQQVIDGNAEPLEKLKGGGTVFDAAEVPPISVGEYVSRLVEGTGASNSAVVAAVAYLDRMTRTTGLLVTPRRIHRAVCAAMVWAVRLVDGAQVDAESYAKAAGVGTKEVERLQAAFSEALGHDVRLRDNELLEYLQDVVFAMAERERE